jgi:hypothetical protein
MTRWRETPPDDEPEPSALHYEEAEEEVRESDWYLNELLTRSEEDLEASDEFQQRVAEKAFEAMEDEIEERIADAQESRMED